MIVFLVGLPGTGKSTVGAALASELGIPFLDTDTVIEKKLEKTVAAIFAEHGEDYFRQEEKTLIQNLASDKMIVSTGGGTPVFGDLMNRMKQVGTVIYLSAPVAFLSERLSADTTRPLLQNETNANTLEELYARRRSVYEQAHHSVSIEDKSVTAIVQEIRSLLT